MIDHVKSSFGRDDILVHILNSKDGFFFIGEIKTQLRSF